MFRPASIRIVLACGILLAAACADNEPTPVAPTVVPVAPAAAVVAAPSTNAASALGNKIAAVCRGYNRKRAALQSELGKAKGDAAATAKIQGGLLALDQMSADACK